MKTTQTLFFYWQLVQATPVTYATCFVATPAIWAQDVQSEWKILHVT
jgi:hypothetical protein